MNLGISGGKTAGENIPNSSLFKLGGLRDNDLSFSFIGLPMMGRYTDEFYMIRSGIQYRLTDTFYLVGKYNMMTYSSDRLSFQKSYNMEIEDIMVMVVESAGIHSLVLFL